VISNEIEEAILLNNLDSAVYRNLSDNSKTKAFLFAAEEGNLEVLKLLIELTPEENRRQEMIHASESFDLPDPSLAFARRNGPSSSF
jgi:hypothetical protein